MISYIINTKLCVTNPRLKSILLKIFNTDILNLGGGRWYLVHWTGVTFVGSWASCTMEEAIYQCCSVDGESAGSVGIQCL